MDATRDFISALHSSNRADFVALAAVAVSASVLIYIAKLAVVGLHGGAL